MTSISDQEIIYTRTGVQSCAVKSAETLDSDLPLKESDNFHNRKDQGDVSDSEIQVLKERLNVAETKLRLREDQVIAREQGLTTIEEGLRLRKVDLRFREEDLNIREEELKIGPLHLQSTTTTQRLQLNSRFALSDPVPYHYVGASIITITKRKIQQTVSQLSDLTSMDARGQAPGLNEANTDPGLKANQPASQLIVFGKW
ncbi:uncharacterized protein EDB91DRAFT_1078571 [Suillus paluster]|uniref:uncharacterized protein n=1 Tax=Suillus paluster TaxID=48578 RepID=UPI001B879A90|nr:uncharacterized protein EDB91DRAFT_1078571 [Suillus paluster]KAG1750550.1 hypothetical protein EDB91DRAFT_1078571 [Suillus paluster]